MKHDNPRSDGFDEAWRKFTDNKNKAYQLMIQRKCTRASHEEYKRARKMEKKIHKEKKRKHMMEHLRAIEEYKSKKLSQDIYKK